MRADQLGEVLQGKKFEHDVRNLFLVSNPVCKCPSSFQLACVTHCADRQGLSREDTLISQEVATSLST
jgi:hypothetical protein